MSHVIWVFAVSNPIPSNLKSEAKKAAKILRDFTEISSRNGPDKLIPAHVIAKAEGLAIISVIKAGFMITARGGSGVVIARLPDKRKITTPSMLCKGLEFSNFLVPPQVSDLVIILNYRRAVEAFTKGGNLTLGGNATVAVGPVGRNVEADVALRSTAAVYTYCRSRGLFAGISLEGSCLIERKETNRKFYSQDIRASAILNGDVEPPSECYDLYHILDVYTEAYTSDWTSKNLQTRVPTGLMVVTATHPFAGEQPGDLSFVPGDRITVITKTDSQYDWWEGQLEDGRVGIFPANFVTY
uniref:SH3 domain-containing YSC84-like protein 1 n=1 Tax=Pundamilia nyererei TaxID=303518 RepID=A0A3B4H0D7_9CICH